MDLTKKLWVKVKNAQTLEVVTNSLLNEYLEKDLIESFGVYDKEVYTDFDFLNENSFFLTFNDKFDYLSFCRFVSEEFKTKLLCWISGKFFYFDENGNFSTEKNPFGDIGEDKKDKFSNDLKINNEKNFDLNKYTCNSSNCLCGKGLLSDEELEKNNASSNENQNVKENSVNVKQELESDFLNNVFEWENHLKDNISAFDKEKAVQKADTNIDDLLKEQIRDDEVSEDLVFSDDEKCCEDECCSDECAKDSCCSSCSKDYDICLFGCCSWEECCWKEVCKHECCLDINSEVDLESLDSLLEDDEQDLVELLENKDEESLLTNDPDEVSESDLSQEDVNKLFESLEEANFTKEDACCVNSKDCFDSEEATKDDFFSDALEADGGFKSVDLNCQCGSCQCADCRCDGQTCECANKLIFESANVEDPLSTTEIEEEIDDQFIEEDDGESCQCSDCQWADTQLNECDPFNCECNEEENDSENLELESSRNLSNLLDSLNDCCEPNNSELLSTSNSENEEDGESCQCSDCQWADTQLNSNDDQESSCECSDCQCDKLEDLDESCECEESSCECSDCQCEVSKENCECSVCQCDKLEDLDESCECEESSCECSDCQCEVSKENCECLDCQCDKLEALDESWECVPNDFDEVKNNECQCSDCLNDNESEDEYCDDSCDCVIDESNPDECKCSCEECCCNNELENQDESWECVIESNKLDETDNQLVNDFLGALESKEDDFNSNSHFEEIKFDELNNSLNQELLEVCASVDCDQNNELGINEAARNFFHDSNSNQFANTTSCNNVQCQCDDCKCIDCNCSIDLSLDDNQNTNELVNNFFETSNNDDLSSAQVGIGPIGFNYEYDENAECKCNHEENHEDLTPQFFDFSEDEKDCEGCEADSCENCEGCSWDFDNNFDYNEILNSVEINQDKDEKLKVENYVSNELEVEDKKDNVEESYECECDDEVEVKPIYDLDFTDNEEIKECNQISTLSADVNHQEEVIPAFESDKFEENLSSCECDSADVVEEKPIYNLDFTNNEEIKQCDQIIALNNDVNEQDEVLPTFESIEVEKDLSHHFDCICEDEPVEEEQTLDLDFTDNEEIKKCEEISTLLNEVNEMKAFEDIFKDDELNNEVEKEESNLEEEIKAAINDGAEELVSPSKKLDDGLNLDEELSILDTLDNVSEDLHNVESFEELNTNAADLELLEKELNTNINEEEYDKVFADLESLNNNESSFSQDIDLNDDFNSFVNESIEDIKNKDLISADELEVLLEAENNDEPKEEVVVDDLDDAVNEIDFNSFFNEITEDDLIPDPNFEEPVLELENENDESASFDVPFEDVSLVEPVLELENENDESASFDVSFEDVNDETFEEVNLVEPIIDEPKEEIVNLESTFNNEEVIPEVVFEESVNGYPENEIVDFESYFDQVTNKEEVPEVEFVESNSESSQEIVVDEVVSEEPINFDVFFEGLENNEVQEVEVQPVINDLVEPLFDSQFEGEEDLDFRFVEPIVAPEFAPEVIVEPVVKEEDQFVFSEPKANFEELTLNENTSSDLQSEVKEFFSDLSDELLAVPDTSDVINSDDSNIVIEDISINSNLDELDSNSDKLFETEFLVDNLVDNKETNEVSDKKEETDTFHPDISSEKIVSDKKVTNELQRFLDELRKEKEKLRMRKINLEKKTAKVKSMFSELQSSSNINN